MKIEMEQKLVRFLENHHINLNNKKIIVAISGGPDSVALLHVLKEWRHKWNIHLIAVTINHQLREEAVEDVRYVSNLCHHWNIPLISEKINVREYEQRHKVSTQVAARSLRYHVFEKVMAEEEADYLALGHHGDDQIETMIMSMMRMTNLSGLSGIPFHRPFKNGEIIRPLLAVTRVEIEQYCQFNDLVPRIDLSNEDISYTRNYIRKLVVPKLKKKNESLHVTMQQLAETLREDEAYLHEEANKAFEKIVRSSEDKRKVTISIATLRQYATSLQRRIYRLTLDYLYEILRPQLSYSHEQIFLSLLKENADNKLLHFPQQLMVEVVYGNIEFYFNEKKAKTFATYINDIPATVPLPDGNVLEINYQHTNDHQGKHDQYICSASQVTFPLHIRTRKPGDRMRYKGLNGSKKIKDIFIDEKIPRNDRDEIIVVADDEEEILWLIGVRKGVLMKPPKEGTLYLSLTYKKPEGDIHA